MTAALRPAAQRVSERTAAGRGQVPSVKPFALTVAAIRDLGPRMRRITLGGTSLLDFGTDDDGLTWDLRIKLVIPTLGRPLPPVEAFTWEDDDGSARSWHQAWLRMPETERGEVRSYTVREARLDAAYPEIDVDFVLHPDGPQGPAARWARLIRIGDPALMIGPSASAGGCAGVEFAPGRARHVLLAGDETALPAIAGILRDVPAGLTAKAMIEVPDSTGVQDLKTRANAEIEWLIRGRRTRGELLAEAVRRAVAIPMCSPGPAIVERVAAVAEPLEVGPERVLVWDTPQYRRMFSEGPQRVGIMAAGAVGGGGMSSGQPFYVWIAGESAMVTALRRYLVRDCGIDREQVAFMGYWKQGVAQR